MAGVLAAFAMVVASCSGSEESDTSTVAAGESAIARSSGELTATDARGSGAGFVAGGAARDSGARDGVGDLRPLSDAAADPGATGNDAFAAGEEPTDPEAGAGPIASGDGDGDSEVVPRDDGIELVFADGALGPAELGTSIEEIAAALGSSYQIAPEEFIRADFGPGYSVSRAGEVLFWAIEEAGVITVFMSTNPRVGLESGLRPKLGLGEAILLHGEPAFTLGPEGREFVAFTDGTGASGVVGADDEEDAAEGQEGDGDEGDGDDAELEGGIADPVLGAISVLVAIGDFGGPVGDYDASTGTGIGARTVGYQLEEANIKELWFWAE